ncbi:MAG: hypothetical protein WCG19_08585 [Chlorobiaceae bacterium]
MFLHVKEAKYLGDYKVKVAFNNGREGVADLAPEYIYFQAFKGDPQLKPQFKQWGYIT